MRRGALIFIIANLLVIGFLVHSVSTLLSLLFEDAAGDAISRTELPAPNSTFNDEKTPVVPRIIHQTYKNASIPVIWQDAQQSCLDLHPDYEYMVSKRSGTWVVVNTDKGSSGRTRNQRSLSQRNIRGSWRRFRIIDTQSSAPTPSDTLCWLTMEESTLISTM